MPGLRFEGCFRLGLLARNQQRADGKPDGQQQQERHRRAHDCPVPARPFGRPLPRRGSPSADRLLIQEPPQVIGQLLDGGVTVFDALGHRLEHDRFQINRDCPVVPPGRARLIEGDLPQQLLPVAAIEGGFQRQQLVQGSAQ